MSIDKIKRTISPVAWVPTVYFAMGMPFVVLNMVTALMFKGLGISDAQIAFWTSIIMFPWTIKPLCIMSGETPMEEMTAIAFLTIVVIFSPFWMRLGALIVKEDISVSVPIQGCNGISKKTVPCKDAGSKNKETGGDSLRFPSHYARFRLRPSSVLPRRGHQQCQHRKQLQTPGKHIEDQHYFRSG